MLRVAYVTPWHFHDDGVIGGGERWPLNIARGVVAAGAGNAEVEIISFGTTASRRELEPGLTLRLLPTSAHRNDMSVSPEITAALEGFEVVHVQQPFTLTGEIASLAALLHGAVLCLTDLGGTSSRIGLTHGLLDIADAVVAYSEYGARILNARRPVTVIEGGVDGDVFHPPATPLPRDRAVFVGRLMPHKGIDRLIAALPADLPLYICGRPYHAEYVDLLHRMAEGKQVTFITDADDATILDLYQRALAVILPSTHWDIYGNHHPFPELMGLTLLEAAACGAPAICSNITAMPEFVEPGETGFVFDTTEELTEILSRLAASPELVARLGAQGRAAVEQRFHHRVAGARMLDLYRSLLRSGVAAARA